MCWGKQSHILRADGFLCLGSCKGGESGTREGAIQVRLPEILWTKQVNRLFLISAPNTIMSCFFLCMFSISAAQNKLRAPKTCYQKV